MDLLEVEDFMNVKDFMNVIPTAKQFLNINSFKSALVCVTGTRSYLVILLIGVEIKLEKWFVNEVTKCR